MEEQLKALQKQYDDLLVKHHEVLDDLQTEKATNAALVTEVKETREKLVTLQNARGEFNRRKARKLARQMVFNGEVA